MPAVISLVGVNSGAPQGGAGAFPAGVQAGDLVVLSFLSQSSAAPGVPAGWTNAGGYNATTSSGNTRGGRLCYKVYAPGDTLPGCQMYAIAAYRNVAAVVVNTSDARNWRANSLWAAAVNTPAGAGFAHVIAYQGDAWVDFTGNNLWPPTTPASYTQRAASGEFGAGTGNTERYSTGIKDRLGIGGSTAIAQQNMTIGGSVELTNHDFDWSTASLILSPVNNAPTAPGVPGVAPTTVDTNGTISWTAATDPDGDAMTYDVELSTNNGGAYAVIAAGVAGLNTVYNFSGQPSTTTAKLRVRAKDSAGVYGPYATMAGNFTINHNAAPTAATGLSPDGGTVVDRALVQRLAWTFNDPNPGDTQSKFDLRWRVGVGAWTTVTQTTTNRYYDAPAATFPAGSVEWQVLPYDALGLAATAWSASAFFTAATAPAAPAITSPANNSAQGAPTGVLAWSAPTQDAYQVRKVADNAGVANTSVVYYDTGTVVSTTARDAALDFPTNNRTEHLQVRIRSAGLWSTWSSVKVNVAWSPPAVPTLVATAQPTLAAIDVAVTHPAPAGTQPVVASTELWRRVVGSGSAGERLKLSVVGGAYRDVTPASGVAYEYQAVAIGTTGTKQASAWTP